ncbi:MAG: type II toxin-antitoxin system VapC family toxin [Anaerolineales bacterium]
MNVVDSSGWLEYFADSQRADLFAAAIEDTEHLLVPVICLYEVFKKILQSEGQEMAEICAADMLKGKVVEITAPIALHAALLSARHRLPMADSLILAVAREHDAILWTQDEHFEGLEGVRYFPKE